MAHVAPLWTAAPIVPVSYEKSKEIAEAAKKHGLYIFGKMTHFIRHKDEKQFINCDAFENVKPTMQLIAVDAGRYGSLLPEINLTHSKTSVGQLPRLAWKNPGRGTNSFALIIEDLDARMQRHMHHGLFYNIPSDRLTIDDKDAKTSEGRNFNRITNSALSYITTGNKEEPYVPPAPSYGHGTHRYQFTIVALTDLFISFDRPHKVTVEEFKESIRTSVVSYGQWVGLVDGNDKKALYWNAEDEEPISPINDPGADRAFTGGPRF